ncbi:MAG: antibiotic resistance protein VanZ [Desulfitibacter sp. BRH_c19]|nr:MAG: antibiotic resistance protein VanZ [Desulfitibacter sp. BRH_c19]
MRKTFFLVLIAYFMLLGYWMLFGFGRIAGSMYMYNLEPFSTIKHFLNFNKLNKNVWVINLIGNIGVFIPFGFLIPLALKLSYLKSLGVFLIGLTLLEVSQLITKRGSFDVDDFILNSFGFILGYVVFKLMTMWVNSRRGGTI